MRIMVIGATGTIGGAVVDLLGGSHDVIEVGHTGGDHRVDLALRESIRELFESVGSVDAVVSAAGEAEFGPLDQLTDRDFALTLENKLMGQANVVRIGHGYVADGGSITLTSGVLSQEPMEGSAAVSMANAGLEGFTRAAALELGPSTRVNVVSPIWVAETLEAMGRDPSGGMPAAEVARAYRESVEGDRTGEVLDVREFA